MRLIGYFLPILLGLGVLTGCDDDTDALVVTAPAPTNLSFAFAIADDNSGRVTITPGGESVTGFTVDFGDGSPVSELLAAGESVTHVYAAGTYTVGLEAVTLDGQTASMNENLMVEFRAPENLAVTVTPTPGNSLSVDLTATADLASSFLVYWGADAGAEPVELMPGQTISYAYPEAGTYQIRVVARNGGSQTIEQTVEVTVEEPNTGGGGGNAFGLTFEDGEFEWLGFGGATGAVVDNPDASGENTSNRVVELNKGENSEVWAGIVYELDAPINFGEETELTMKTWSPKAGIPILLKIENASNADIFAEVTATTTVASGWETLTFDFAGADLNQQYSKVVVFFDFGTPGDGSSYYFDDVAVAGQIGGGGGGTGGGSGDLELPLSFESGEFEWIGFGGANVEIIDNPDANGLNTSGRVAQLTKGEGSEVWAGAVLELPAAINFGGRTQVRMKVWSPKAGIPILFKLENASNADIFTEITATTTGADAWEELTFDLSGADFGQAYSKVVVFFDFGTPGDGSAYYFDDIEVVE